MTERDRLANDLNRICPDLSDTFCGNTSCTSCLSHELTKEGYRKASEVAEEIFSEIETFIIDQCFLTDAGVAKIYKKLVEIRNSYKEKGK